MNFEQLPPTFAGLCQEQNAIPPVCYKKANYAVNHNTSNPLFLCRDHMISRGYISLEMAPDPKLAAVVHPHHYGGDWEYEPIKVIAAWGLNFALGSVLKYIYREGKKKTDPPIEGLRKARFYLDADIKRREGEGVEDTSTPKSPWVKIIDGDSPGFGDVQGKNPIPVRQPDGMVCGACSGVGTTHSPNCLLSHQRRKPTTDGGHTPIDVIENGRCSDCKQYLGTHHAINCKFTGRVGG